MHTTIPFCERCGRVGARLAGTRSIDDGHERWTLYVCGHETIQLFQDSAPTTSAPALNASA